MIQGKTLRSYKFQRQDYVFLIYKALSPIKIFSYVEETDIPYTPRTTQTQTICGPNKEDVRTMHSVTVYIDRSDEPLALQHVASG